MSLMLRGDTLRNTPAERGLSKPSKIVGPTSQGFHRVEQRSMEATDGLRTAARLGRRERIHASRSGLREALIEQVDRTAREGWTPQLLGKNLSKCLARSAARVGPLEDGCLLYMGAQAESRTLSMPRMVAVLPAFVSNVMGGAWLFVEMRCHILLFVGSLTSCLCWSILRLARSLSRSLIHKST